MGWGFAKGGHLPPIPHWRFSEMVIRSCPTCKHGREGEKSNSCSARSPYLSQIWISFEWMLEARTKKKRGWNGPPTHITEKKSGGKMKHVKVGSVPGMFYIRTCGSCSSAKVWLQPAATSYTSMQASRTQMQDPTATSLIDSESCFWGEH